MMKRKVALLMTTVMLATSVFPAGITAYAEDAVVTGETAVEATLDETSEESVDASALNGDVNVPDEDAGLEVDAAQAEETTQAADDELQPDELVAEDIAADEAMQDAPAEDGEQVAPIVADGGLVISDVEVVDEASPVDANTGVLQDGKTKATAIEMVAGSEYDVSVTAGGSKWFSFTPSQSTAGEYVFTSYKRDGDSADPYVNLYDTEELLTHKDDIEDSNNFRLEYSLKEEITYYFEAKCYDDDAGTYHVGFYQKEAIKPQLVTVDTKTLNITAHTSRKDALNSLLMTVQYGSNLYSEQLRVDDIGEYNDQFRFVFPDGVLDEDGYFAKSGDNQVEVWTGYYKYDEEKDDEVWTGDTKVGEFTIKVNLLDTVSAQSLTVSQELNYVLSGNGFYYATFTPGDEGFYVIQRSVDNYNYGQSKLMIFDGDTLVAKAENDQGLVKVELNAEKKYVILLRSPYDYGYETGTLKVGAAYSGVPTIELEMEKEQNASSVLANGLDFTLKVQYGEELEKFSYRNLKSKYDEYDDSEDYYILTSNGDMIAMTYNNETSLPGEDKCILGDGSLEAVLEGSESSLSATALTTITDDLKFGAVSVTKGSPYSVQTGSMITAASYFRCPEGGSYHLSSANIVGFRGYQYGEGTLCRSDFSPDKFDSTEVTYFFPLCEGTFTLTDVPDVNGISIVKNPAKTVYELDEDNYAYIDYDDMVVRVTYKNNTTRDVNVGEWDIYDNRVLPYICKLDSSGRPIGEGDSDTDIYTAGEYALYARIWVGYDEDEEKDIYKSTPTFVKITVTPHGHVHSWSWTTTKNADVYGPATQTGRCTCGVTTTRTVGTKLAPVLTLTDNKLTMKTKQSTSKFKVEAMAAGDTLATVTSSNTKLLKVSNVNPNGTFKLKTQGKTGTAKLTITLKSGLSKTIKVKIQAAKVKTTKIKVASKKLTLSKKQKYNLAAVVMPVTSYDKVKYTTSNKKVATVNKKGQITAKGKGKATITVKSGKKSVKVKVTVK